MKTVPVSFETAAEWDGAGKWNGFSTRGAKASPGHGVKTRSTFRARSVRALLLFLLVGFTLSASAAIKQELPELRPPRDELPPPVSKTSTVLPWLVTAGIAAILIATFGWSRPPKVQVPESPGTRARRDLQKATTPQAVAQILRHFLLVYFPLPGEGASTEEISESLYANLPSDPTLAHQVTEFLLACDTEKFAPASAGPGAVAAATAAGWAPKDGGPLSSTPAPIGAASPVGGAAEVAASFIDKIEKRRHRRAPERSL